MTSQLSFPTLGFGLGLRAPHYEHVLEQRPKNVDWFEIISENYFEAHSGYWDFLADLRRDYPIVMHGVSMSLGSTDPLNMDYLTKLKKLADFLDVPWLSDHLCWTGVHSQNTHDLLPLPYTEESLRHIVSRIKQVQDFLGRRIILENPSSYVEFHASSIPEWEFLARLAEDADCSLLLDVNNVYVSAFNHGYDAQAYIDAMPTQRIAQIHLAGHHHFGTHIIDTHDAHVLDEVWKLYEYTMAKKGFKSTMIEWDDQIPEFDVLVAELDKARAICGGKLIKRL
ncbi:MAG: DUF692 domain-containing protein [Alphaproteobacteria bacterium]|nr:DUF692 domain-containing protein [Alphaproteobacteria bacterium]